MHHSSSPFVAASLLLTLPLLASAVPLSTQDPAPRLKPAQEPELQVPGNGQQEPLAQLRARADKAFQEQRHLEAAQAYDEVTKRADQDGRAWFRLGYSWHAVGKLFRAIPAHARATEFQEVRPVAFYNLGCAYALGARYDEAYAALESAGRAGFQSLGQNIDQDTDLEGLREDPRFAQWRGRLEDVIAGGDQLETLDFVLGDWDVYDAQGRLIEERSIETTLDGQVVVEQWRAPGGAEGFGLIFQPPGQDTWRRVEVLDTGVVLEMTGKVEGGAARLEGFWTHPDGRQVRQRMTLTPQPGGTLQKRTERSQDGVQWKLAQQTTYRPRAPRGPIDQAPGAPKKKKTNPRLEWK